MRIYRNVCFHKGSSSYSTSAVKTDRTDWFLFEYSPERASRRSTPADDAFAGGLEPHRKDCVHPRMECSDALSSHPVFCTPYLGTRGPLSGAISTSRSSPSSSFSSSEFIVWVLLSPTVMLPSALIRLAPLARRFDLRRMDVWLFLFW